MPVVPTQTYIYVDDNLAEYTILGSQVVDRGTWSPTTFYVVNDAVQLTQDLYLCRKGNQGRQPSAIVDERWSTLIVVEPAVSTGTDTYAREQAALARSEAAYGIALAELALIEIGTFSGSGGTSSDSGALAIAEAAFAIAVDGTNAAAVAYSYANTAYELANDAYALAQIGTNTGTAAYTLASTASSVANGAWELAQIGTNVGSTAYSVAQSAWALAQIGTNVGSTASSIASAAFALAQIGTNVGSAAYTLASTASSVANGAWALAQIGTNVGSTAYSVAQSAFTLAQIGTNVGSTAQSTANSAWALAQIGTNTGSTAYSVAQSAWTLAQIGTSVGKTIMLCTAYTPLVASPDTAEVPVPYSSVDGTTSWTWTMRRLDLRVQTAGSTSTVAIEKSYGNGAFTAVAVGTIALTANYYTGSNITSLGTINSGDFVRFYPLVVGSAQNWTVTVQISHP